VHALDEAAAIQVSGPPLRDRDPRTRLVAPFQVNFEFFQREDVDFSGDDDYSPSPGGQGW
jgi:hypothetical protein